MTNTMEAPAKTFEVLIVEDNQIDVFFIREVLKRSRFAIYTSTITDGDSALTYLRQQGFYHKASRPDLVLLDVHLPRKDGWEVLRAMKQEPDLSSIAVMVLSSSKEKMDEQRARELGANLFLTKPMYLVEFPMLLRAVEELLEKMPYGPPTGPE